MSLVIDLPPGVELQLRLAASAEGLDVSTYVYETIAPRLRPSSSELMSEEELVAKVREDFPVSFWKRFAALAAKRDSEASPPTSGGRSPPLPRRPKPTAWKDCIT